MPHLLLCPKDNSCFSTSLFLPFPLSSSLKKQQQSKEDIQSCTATAFTHLCPSQLIYSTFSPVSMHQPFFLVKVNFLTRSQLFSLDPNIPPGHQPALLRTQMASKCWLSLTWPIFQQHVMRLVLSPSKRHPLLGFTWLSFHPFGHSFSGFFPHPFKLQDINVWCRPILFWLTVISPKPRGQLGDWKRASVSRL